MKRGILTRCEKVLGGWLIAWQGEDQLHWQSLLARVKSLPPRDRRYVPEERAWWVVDGSLDRLWGTFSNIGDAMDTDDPPRRHQTIPPDVSEAFRQLYVTLDAPPDVVTVVYRHLAKALHPDTGGDTAAMKALNNARDVAIAWAEHHAA